MKTIKPNNTKFKTEWYANAILAAISFVLFILNSLKIDIIKQTVNTRILFGILLAVLFVYFAFQTVINFFYKITITETFISFYFPLFTYNRKIPLTSVDRCYMDKTELIILLTTYEVVKVGLRKYSSEQHKEIINEVLKYTK